MVLTSAHHLQAIKRGDEVITDYGEDFFGPSTEARMARLREIVVRPRSPACWRGACCCRVAA